MNHQKIREECCAANQMLPRYGLVDMTFGNVSCLDRQQGVFAIKPSGVDFPQLTPEDMVVVDLEGKKVSGRYRPSSDTETHRRLFLAFEGIGAVVHTHSRNALAFAQAKRGIPCFGTTHADYFYGEIPVTREMTSDEISRGYEWETGNVIVERFKSLNADDVPGVLVCNHGPFTWGENALKAVEHAVALEIVAQAALASLALNPDLPPISAHLLDKHFKRKHGPGRYYGQSSDAKGG
jgi:L-ribulose-5-phosphate 4-epimerase